MRWPRFIGGAGILTGLTALLSLPAMVLGQDVKKQPEPPTPNVIRPSPSEENLKSITDDYNQQLLLLDRGRLERLGRLAARQNPADAAATYEQLFRLAISGNLFRDAEPAAKTVVGSGSPSVTARALAHLVKIIAESDRGAYAQSLESLRQAVADREKAARGGLSRAELPTDELVGICDAYYQRLVQAGQFETARKALRLVLEQTKRPVLKEFVSSRLRRLDQVGKPAPAIRGVDLDGKPFDLADARGKVVLVEFWASWCLPCAAEVDAIRQAADSSRGRGLQVVGINLDALQDGGQKLETVLPSIRRFLLDHNAGWPTLINGQGDQDYAQAYGVTEVPANVLIARDGTVAHIDLVRKNLEPVLARALGE
jgi:peroxiredoxin